MRHRVAHRKLGRVTEHRIAMLRNQAMDLLRNERLEMFFFNVCSVDNGKSWSTPWVIDDPSLYFVRKDAMQKAPKASK